MYKSKQQSMQNVSTNIFDNKYLDKYFTVTVCWWYYDKVKQRVTDRMKNEKKNNKKNPSQM